MLQIFTSAFCSLYACLINFDLPFQVRLARRRNGIEPYLPPAADRDAMKLKYAQTGEIPLTPD